MCAPVAARTQWLGRPLQHPGVVQFLFCDGRVVLLKEPINRDTYRRLSTRAEGDAVSSDAY